MSMNAYQKFTNALSFVTIVKDHMNVSVRVDLFWILQTTPPAMV